VFEKLLVEDGVMLRKYWFSVSDAEQERRFQGRLDDPMRRWKLSPMDLESVTRWEEYSRAKDEMFFHTDIVSAPWSVVEAEDKRRARINMIAHCSPASLRARGGAKLELPRARRARLPAPAPEMFTSVPDHAEALPHAH